jgi:hypothetical protein
MGGRGRILFGVLVVVTIFADGIGLGLYLTSDSGRPLASAPSHHGSTGSQAPTTPSHAGGQPSQPSGTPKAPAPKAPHSDTGGSVVRSPRTHASPHLVRQPLRPARHHSSGGTRPLGVTRTTAPSGSATASTPRGCHALGRGAALHRRLIGDGADDRAPGRSGDEQASCDHPVWGRIWGHSHKQWDAARSYRREQQQIQPDWFWRYRPRGQGWSDPWARHGHGRHRSRGHRG